MRKGFLQTTALFFTLFSLAMLPQRAQAQTQAYLKGVIKIGNSQDGFPNILYQDHFGGGIANIGDLDGDGVADIAIGAYTDAVTSGVTEGSVYILFMNDDGSVKSYIKTTTPSGAIDFGISIAAIGDLDGDGIPDIAVGANGDPNTSTGVKFSGSVYICYLKKTGVFKSTVKIPGNTLPGFSTQTVSGPQFGKRVALIGDYDKDGVNDIVVGCDQDKMNGASVGTTATGSIYIIALKTNGTVKKAVRIDRSSANIGTYISNNDNFGSAVYGIGDYDGDGNLDIAVGAAQNTDNSIINSGAMYILNLDKPVTTGSPAPWGQVKSGGVTKYSASTPGLTNLPTKEFFGGSICYLNNFGFSGYHVFAVGATGDNDYATGAGAVWLLYIDSTTGNVDIVQKISGKNPAIKTSINYISGSDNFGYSICNYSSRDSNSTQRLVIGTPGDTDGNSTGGTGEAYLIDMRKFDLKLDTVIIKGKHDTLCANATAYIGMVVENHSHQPIYNLPVQVDATGSATFSVKDVFNINLGVGKKDTFYLSSAFPTSSSGSYNLKGYIKYQGLGDFNQHNDTSTGVVTVLPALSQPSFGKDTTYLCVGDVVPLDLLNAGASTVYTWYKDGVDMFAVTGEKYTITTAGNYIGIAQIGTCAVSDTIQVYYRKSANVKLGPDQTICYGDSTTLDLGYPDAEHHWFKASDLSWTDSGQVFVVDDNNSDTYWGTVTYNKQCKYADTINITYNHVIVNLGPDTIMCNGQKYVLDAANPSSTYTWYRNGVQLPVTAQTDTVTIPGTYAVKVQNGNCFGVDTMKIDFLSVPSVTFSPSFDTLCKSETRLLDAGNVGYNHIWYKNGVDMKLNDTTTQYTITNDGVYQVVVSNATRAKCNATSSTTETYNILSVSLGQPQSVTYCQGEVRTLTATISTTIGDTKYYQWYKDGTPTSTTQTQTVTDAGKYWVVVKVGKCTAADTVQVNYTPITMPQFGHNDTLLCNGTSITLDAANPGAFYTWHTPRGILTTESISADTTGLYKIHVANGTCTKDTFINVGYIVINVQLGKDDTLCFGRPIALDAKNTNYNATYQWYQDGNPITGATNEIYHPLVTGTYKVIVNQKYCSDSGHVHVYFMVSPDVYHLDTTICDDDSLVLDAHNLGDKILWVPTYARTEKITIRKTLSPTPVRTYKAYVTNGGCTDTSIFNISFYNPVTVALPQDIYLCDTLANGVTLDAGSGFASYDWEPTGDVTQHERITSAGTYTVLVKNIGGCSKMDSTHVYECPPNNVLVPNAFTPGPNGTSKAGDDLNDSFKIYNLNATEYLLTIYNRWGEQVFRSTDPNKAWDGYFLGSPVPEGVYNWTLVYRLHTATGTPPQKIISGYVTLIRH